MEIEIGVAGIVVGDEPVRNFGLPNQIESIERRRVPPAYFVEVLFWSVLSFVDEKIRAREELDEALVRAGELFGDVMERSVMALEQLIVGDVAEALMGGLDFKAVSEAWMVRAVKIEGQITEGNGGFLLDCFELEICFDLFEPNRKKLWREEIRDKLAV